MEAEVEWAGEWERLRRVPFQIDAYLPDGSPVLYVRVRIVNPYGSVRIREVPLQANAQLRVMVQTAVEGENPARLKIETLENGTQLAIEPVADEPLTAEDGWTSRCKTEVSPCIRRLIR